MARNTAEKTQRPARHRRGLRRVQLWVPDLRDPTVAERLGAQVRTLRDHTSEAEIEPLLDANLADIEGWVG